MQRASSVALGGVTAALAVVLMLLGGLVPLAVYVCPMLASLLLLPLLDRLGKARCVLWWAAVSILSVLLCPDRETAFVFVFLGWYPIARPALNRLPRPASAACKLLLFNLCACALYALLILVFQLQALVAEARETGTALLVVILILANVTFLVFDLVLARLEIVIRNKWKK